MVSLHYKQAVSSEISKSYLFIYTVFPSVNCSYRLGDAETPDEDSEDEQVTAKPQGNIVLFLDLTPSGFRV